MKVTFAVEIDVENDWDNTAFNPNPTGSFSEGRKRFVESRLRSAVMQATMHGVAQIQANNGLVITGIVVSEPKWDGWDSSRLAKEMQS